MQAARQHHLVGDRDDGRVQGPSPSHSRSRSPWSTRCSTAGSPTARQPHPARGQHRGRERGDRADDDGARVRRGPDLVEDSLEVAEDVRRTLDEGVPGRRGSRALRVALGQRRADPALEPGQRCLADGWETRSNRAAAPTEPAEATTRTRRRSSTAGNGPIGACCDVTPRIDGYAAAAARPAASWSPPSWRSPCPRTPDRPRGGAVDPRAAAQPPGTCGPAGWCAARAACCGSASRWGCR
jgi:hypothetical protein